MFESLASNPYFNAGFGIVGLTASLALARRALIGAWSIARKQCFATCEVTSRDTSYDWLLTWLGTRHPRHRVSISTSFSDSFGARVQTTLVPATGTFMFNHRGRWIQCERVRQENVITPFESVTLTTLGRDVDAFTDIIQRARDDALRESEGRTVTLLPKGSEWRVFGAPKKSRPLNSVILDDNVMETIVDDVTCFLDSHAWYLARGVPFRRGYLLHGPHGTGKSSLIFALAGHLRMSLAVLNVSDETMTDDRFTHLMLNAQRDSIVVIEDIDAPFTADFRGRITRSGLLNVIDGISASDGRVLFATTNHVTRIDPALLRAGRFDMHVLVGLASDSQVRRAFARFYPEDVERADTFLANVRRHGNTSMAQIQAHFLRHKNDARAAAETEFGT